MKCPYCENGTMLVLFAKKVDPSATTPTTLPCPYCEGTTEIPDEMIEWMQRGKELKQLRLKKGLGLRECAFKFGMMPSDWCDAEHGRNPELLERCFALLGTHRETISE